MSTSPPTRKKKILGALGTAGAFGAVIVWYLLGGGWGAKDFSGQDLRDRGDEFHRADMVKANFSEANISYLEMIGCNLHEANLEGVIAEGTNLSTAKFRRTNLRNANLRGADLTEADFWYADLTGADLRGADLRGASLANATLDNADLRNVLTGPYCPGRREYNTPEWCEVGDDGCCSMGWGGSMEVEDAQVCRTPWWELFRVAADDPDSFGVLGEPIYDDVETFDNGRHICTTQPPEEQRLP